jgi:hypothetical protein
MLGKAEKIVDPNFNQEKDRFNEHHKAVQKISKDATKVLDLLQGFYRDILGSYILLELMAAQAVLAEDFYNMYDTNCPLYNAASKHQDATKIIDNTRQQAVRKFKIGDRVATGYGDLPS